MQELARRSPRRAPSSSRTAALPHGGRARRARRGHHRRRARRARSGAGLRDTLARHARRRRRPAARSGRRRPAHRRRAHRADLGARARPARRASAHCSKMRFVDELRRRRSPDAARRRPEPGLTPLGPHPAAAPRTARTARLLDAGCGRAISRLDGSRRTGARTPAPRAAAGVITSAASGREPDAHPGAVDGPAHVNATSTTTSSVAITGPRDHGRACGASPTPSTPSRPPVTSRSTRLGDGRPPSVVVGDTRPQPPAPRARRLSMRTTSGGDQQQPTRSKSPRRARRTARGTAAKTAARSDPSLRGCARW